MSKNNLSVLCPTCKKQTIWKEHPITRPFCSDRCKLIDLGEWASDKKVIPGESVYIESTNEDSSLH